MDSLTAEDVAALREQGDFRAFLASISAPTRPPAPTATAAEPGPERDPCHRPGAWPAGTSRPAPNTTALADWQHALAEYRHWSNNGRPRGNHACHCGTCPNTPATGANR